MYTAETDNTPDIIAAGSFGEEQFATCCGLWYDETNPRSYGWIGSPYYHHTYGLTEIGCGGMYYKDWVSNSYGLFYTCLMSAASGGKSKDGSKY